MVRKRAFDLVVGLALVVVALPMIVLFAIGVGWSLRTWKVFFVQMRVGRGGREFRMLKLRTMPPATPRYATKDHLAVEIPRFCVLLRKTHLDELPQLLSVVSGKLSLVGPRPRMPCTYEPVAASYRRMPEAVPQGCTGLWQISPHQDEMPHAHPEYDALYVSRWTLRLDVWILAVTLLRFAGIAGTRSLDDVPESVLAPSPDGADNRAGLVDVDLTDVEVDLAELELSESAVA